MSWPKALSYAMWPLAFLMGVPQQDCLKVGLLIGSLAYTMSRSRLLLGEKTVLNDARR